VAEGGVRLSGELLTQRLDNPRLADAGLARKQHHLSFAVGRAPPAREQQIQLFLATDERSEVSPVQRLEAAFRRARAHHPPGAYRLAESLDGVSAKVGQLEQPTYQSAGRLTDHHTARHRERLQSCR
jgi:hypothetical protein